MELDNTFTNTENQSENTEPQEENEAFSFGAAQPQTFTNEYEDSIDGALERLNGVFADQSYNMRAANIENGLATDPIKYGKAKRIAERRGADVDLVFDNFEEFEKKDKELLLADIVSKNPALKELATDDPEFMKLAANDCDKLKEISDNLTIYGEMEKPFAPVAWAKKASYIYNEQEERLDTFEEIGDLMTKDDPESQARLALLVDKANQNPLVDTSGIDGTVWNTIETLPYQKRTTLPMMGATFAGAAADAVISAKVGAAGGAAAGAVATPAGSAAGATVGAVGGAVAGTIKGATVGWAAGNLIAFKNTYDVETGAMYANLAVMKDENGKGFDREDMVAASRIYGGISAAIELVPANTLARVFPWYQKAKKGLLKAGLKKSIMESVKNKTVMQVWGNVLKSVTASVVTETGEEILQETAQIIGERALKESYNNKQGYEFTQNTLDEDSERVAQAGVQGFKATLLMPALGGAWRGRVETKAVREVQAIDALQKGDEAKAQLDIARLDKTQAQIEQLGELKDNPDKMQAFFQKVSRKSDIRDIYMEAQEAKAILASEAVAKNMDVMRRYGLIESIERQLSNAQTDDAPIKIPFDVWGSTVMTKQELWGAFRDVVKTYEDGTTMKQLMQNQKVRANILADGKKAAAENQLDFDYIYKGLFEDAAAAGYSREQAKEAATQNAYFYLGLARAAGQNAVDIYRQDRLQFNYSIDGQNTRSAELDNIMDVIREEQLSNADANLVRASRAIARRDVNAIKKILMKKIENPTAGDVREYIRLFNAVSDMRLKLDGMSNEDFATALQEYTSQSPVTVDIKRTDADRVKSGIFSASETALKDIQADGNTQDYVAVAGGRVPVNYEIVELSDLITSHNTDGMVNEAYPQALQPRDRSRSASDAQIAEIVNRFEPARVAKAPTATEGAPIVTKEGYVAVGNGRAMALSKVYETSDKSQAYKDYLQQQGFDISNFAEPVLIRRLAIDLNDEQLSALVDDANTAGTMQYSDAEKAIAYSKKLNSNIINLLDTDAELESAANTKFIRAFFAEVVPTGERNAFLDKDDRVTRKGIEMIENTLVSIIVPDTRFLSVLVENPDNNIRKVTSGLAKAAPNIVAFENDIQSGDVAADYSIAPTVRQAVEILKRAKDKGQTTALYVQQLDMLEGQIPADVLAMVDLFDNAKSAQDFNEKIKSYIRNATEQGDTRQDNMFGLAPVSKTELLEREAKQISLFQRGLGLSAEDKGYVSKFKDFVARVFNKALTKQEKSRDLDIGKTPQKLIEAGLPQYNLAIGYKVIEKASDGRNNDHLLTKEVISNVLEALHNPVGVVKAELNKNEKENNRYGVIVDLRNEAGQYVLVGIDAGKKAGDNSIINDIRSIHSRQSFVPYLDKAVKDDRLLKIDADKIKGLIPSNQPDIISGGSGISLLNTILQDAEKVNKNNTIFYQRGGHDELTGDLFAEPANAQAKPLPISVKKQVDDLFSYAEKQEGTTKELPLFSTVGETKKIEKTYQAPKQIEDAGDSLLGNLKRNAKVYTWEELEGMNDLLRRKYVTKAYIYPRPTIDELRGKGIDGRAAAVVEYVYNSINAKPAKNVNDTLANQKRFFEIVHRTMDKTIEYAKEHKAEIAAWRADMGFNYDIFNAVFPSGETNPRLIFRGNKEYNTEALVAGGNKFLNSMMITGYDLAKLDAIAQDFDKEVEEKSKEKAEVEPWQKHFTVVKKPYQEAWFVVDSNGKAITRDLTFSTQEKAAEFAQKAYELVKPYLKGQGETVDFSGMRKALPRRQNNQNVNPEALMQTFGFRGVNFGNWTKQSERQEFLNLTYDSLLDMTEILGIPPKAIGLEGKLGLAFGAQGRAGAAGHFMPEFNEINLTRKNGAGSLAHEWWHALDYYFGDQSLGKDFSGKAVLDLDKQGNLRSETYEAIRNLYQQISTADMSDAEVSERYKAQVERITFMVNYRANEIKNKFTKAKNAAEIARFIDNMVAVGKNYDGSKDEQYLSDFQDMIEERRRTAELAGQFFDLQYRLRQLNKLDDNTSSWRKVSKYYDTATKLNRATKDKKGYWTQHTELGARAFASYINDKVAANDWFNYFLAGHAKMRILDENSYVSALMRAEETKETVDINDFTLPVYPADEVERANINAAFDRLFKVIEVDEANNFRLYQNEADEALGAYSPSNLTITLFKNNNMTTLIHESGHFWRDMIRKYAAKEGATDKLKEYSETLENWLSDEWSKHNEIVPQEDGTYRLYYNGEDDGRAFANFDDAVEVAKHECFARAVEKYFYTAEAPTYGLRKVFAAFKKWLSTKYKDAVDKFNVDITPEVKNVFDRLLATDGEIEQYVMEKRIQAIFDTPDAAKMTEKQFENYQTYVDNMLSIAKDDYYKAVAQTVYKEQSQDFERKLNDIRQDVLLDYTVGSNANRFVAALVYGKLGGGDIDISLNQAEMESIFNAKVENGIARLPKRLDGSNIYTADGSTLKELGEFFNLDETEMKTALSTSPRLINSIENAAKYKAHEELGNPVSYADVEAQVMKSIANEKYESLLTTELSKLSTNPESKNIMAHALIMQAEDEIGKLNVGEIKPDEYFNASLKYGDKALVALNKGNKKAALAYKQQQLKQFYLYKEALRQADYVKKAINRLKEIGKQEVNTSVNQQHQDAARAILARYNLAAIQTQQQKERFENIGRWIDEQRAAGYDIDIPDSFLQAINRRDWQEMTVDELGILFEGIKNIIHNGREIKEYELAGKQLDKEKTIERLRTQLAKTYKPDSKERTGKQEKHAIKDLIETIDTNIITAGGLSERIDNADINGVMHDVILRPLADGQNIENDLLARYGKRLNDLNKSLPKQVQAQMFENVDGAKEVLGANYTRAELISIGLNMGNWYNLQRLKDDNGLKDNQLAWITNKLSAEEWDYIQNVWDLLDGMYPMLEEHQKKMSGLDMDKVFPMPVITPYGKYRGGYFPIVYDMTAERKAQEANSTNGALLDGDYGRASTSKGYTKSRKDIVRAMPLKLGLGIISQHIATVIHDVAYRQIIRQQWNFLNDSEVVGIFENYGLDKYRDGLVDLLRKIANQPNRDARAAKELEGYLRILRNRTTVMGLGFRLSTAMSQLMGYTASIAAMSQRGRKNGAKHGGAYWLMQGVSAFLRSKQNREWAIANSHELRTRLNNNDVNVAEAMKGVAQPKTTRQTLEAAITKGGFWLIGKMDFVVAQTTWFGAYQQARKDMGKNHQDAVFYADRIMLDSQGSGNLKDTTLFQRGGEVKKSMALFFSPFAGLYQLWTQAAKDMKDKRDFKGAAQDMFTMFCVAAWMEGIIKGDLPTDDDDEAMDWVKFFLINPIFYWMSTIPILRDMAGFMEYGRAQPTIYTKAAQVAYEPVNDIRKAATGKTVEANKFIKDLMNAIAMGTGVPVGGQVADYADYYTGLMLDNKQADGLGDILYGLYRGKERK